MNRAQREMFDRLEAMPISQARLEIATGTFGEVDSPNYTFCSSWLAAKEADLREAREERLLAIEDRISAMSERSLALAAEDLAIARSSSESAREQARWAKWAAIVATTAAIIATKEEILKVIF